MNIGLGEWRSLFLSFGYHKSWDEDPSGQQMEDPIDCKEMEDSIARTAGLSLTDSQKCELYYALVEFEKMREDLPPELKIALEKHFEQTRRRLAQIGALCRKLAGELKWIGEKESLINHLDELAHQITPETRPQGRPFAYDVYWLVQRLHRLYRAAGGSGRGYWKDRIDGTYRGQFLEMILEIFWYMCYQYTSKNALGAKIERTLNTTLSN